MTGRPPDFGRAIREEATEGLEKATAAFARRPSPRGGTYGCGSAIPREAVVRLPAGPRRRRLPHWAQTLTPSCCSTGPIGLAKDELLPPAKQSPTGFSPVSVTMSEPESPDLMKVLAT